MTGSYWLLLTLAESMWYILDDTFDTLRIPWNQKVDKTFFFTITHFKVTSSLTP